MLQAQSYTNISFNRHPRRQQEIRGRPFADSIYRSIFGDIAIARDNMVLDKQFAIDAVITMSNGMPMTGQEKFLSSAYASFRSITVEYHQVAATGEPGDWFKLPPMFYFVGYFNEGENGFDPWCMVNWPLLVMASNVGLIPWHDSANRDGHARASFKFVAFDDIPASCIIAQSSYHR